MALRRSLTSRREPVPALFAESTRSASPGFALPRGRRPGARCCRVAGMLAGLLTLWSVCGCVTTAGSAAASIWVVGDTHALGADSTPALENEVFSAERGTVNLTAAINETVAFQIGLRTDHPPAGPFDVRIGDLTGPAGTLPAAVAVRRYCARYVRVDRFESWYPLRTGRAALPAYYPDVLVPWAARRGGGPLRLDGRRTEIVWVDLRVPPTTAPGVYETKLDVVVPRREQPVFTARLRLTVLPVALPSEPSLEVLCRVDPRDLLADHLRWPRLPAEETRFVAGAPAAAAGRALVGETMRLLHEHRMTPLLWAAFPKYRPAGPGEVEVDWTGYDALVSDWLSGDAFADRAGLARWIIPASAGYPNARRNGGFASPGYARLLAAYLRACEAHFKQKGWLARSILRLAPPAPLTQSAVERLRRIVGIVRQSETRLPVVAHLPARSLAPLGWYHAPAIEVSGAAIWAPPAWQFEPQAMRQEHNLGKEVWLVPDDPPYSGSLAVEAPPTDARELAWQAFRYGADAIWIEDAAAPLARSRSGAVAAGRALLASGAPWGLDTPVPTIRLKRLRRGALDYEILNLLTRQGQPLLAQRTSEQVVRWAFTEACDRNLLDTRPVGWPDNPYLFWMARKLLLQELVNELAPSDTGRNAQIANLADWSTILDRTHRVTAEIRGVRLETTQTARVLATITNGSRREVRARVALQPPVPGWKLDAPALVRVPAGGRSVVDLPLHLGTLTENADGIRPFVLRFDGGAGGVFSAAGRLAVIGCPQVAESPAVDGDLSDWLLAAGNVAGDFRLVRGDGSPVAGVPTRRPALPTQAFFCMDRDNLYVAIRCGLRPGEPPLWRADNYVTVDGAIPWGQDVVELLLDPHNTRGGTAANIYCLQVKPSGLLVARKGCLTEPPLAAAEVWESGARVAVSRQRDGWTVELALPLKSLGRGALRNAIWGCNITRLDARRGEYSSWSAARGYTYAPELLGNLILLRP